VRLARLLLAVVSLTALFVLAPAAPAFAHGTGGNDVTNFRSRVTGIWYVDSKGKPTSPASAPGVKWEVLANDSLLKVTNNGSEEVLVRGYQDEPYLRVGPGGVFRNRNSPATYLNQNRYAAVDVPAGVNPKAAPDWEKVGDGNSFYWHDHRIHWMSPSLPPAVAASNQHRSQRINEWSVPFSMGSKDLVVTGKLDWIPAPPAWPWLLAAFALTVVPLLGALAVPKGFERMQALLRIGAAVIGAVIFLDLIHTVDDVASVPATFFQNLGAVTQALLFLGLAVVGLVWAWKGDQMAGYGLAIAGGSVAIGIGVSHAFTLAASQIATKLPQSISRMVAAGSLMVIVTGGLVTAIVLRAISKQSQASTR
jgi:hypothetical protein